MSKRRQERGNKVKSQDMHLGPALRPRGKLEWGISYLSLPLITRAKYFLTHQHYICLTRISYVFPLHRQVMTFLTCLDRQLDHGRGSVINKALPEYSKGSGISCQQSDFEILGLGSCHWEAMLNSQSPFLVLSI